MPVMGIAQRPSPGRHHPIAEGLGPLHQAHRAARLVAVGHGVDDAIGHRPPAEDCPQEDVGLDGDVDDVSPGAKGRPDDPGRDFRAPRRLDDHVQGQLGQPRPILQQGRPATGHGLGRPPDGTGALDGLRPATPGGHQGGQAIGRLDVGHGQQGHAPHLPDLGGHRRPEPPGAR
jgi:hypothetical protein